MKKGIENTLWNMKECGCQEDIIKEYKAVDCMDYLIYEIENSET